MSPSYNQIRYKVWYCVDNQITDFELFSDDILEDIQIIESMTRHALGNFSKFPSAYSFYRAN